MRKFWGCYQNASYCVGCNGGTVYIYDRNGTELAKFRDFPYAYTAAFQPNANIIAVKSTAGFLGFYDLDALSLLKKISFSKIEGQDEGFAFAPDGRYFYNIEQPADCQTQLCVYDMESLEKIRTLFPNEKKMFLSALEFGPETGNAFVLGFLHDDTYGLFDYGFVGKLDMENGSVTNLHRLSVEQYEYLHWYKSWENHGFTEKSLAWNPLRRLDHIEKTSIKAVFDAATP